MADDPRDARLAELLEVEPLDELTRRRLVAHALDESTAARAGRSWQLIAGRGGGRRGDDASGWWRCSTVRDPTTLATNEQALRRAELPRPPARRLATPPPPRTPPRSADAAASPAPQANESAAPSESALERAALRR